MRRDFAKMLLEEMKLERGKDIVVLSADMGYGLWDDVRKEFPGRFVNFGSAEQLMIGAAAGMALEGLIPVCYSITTFLLYRPFEFIRNFMNHDKIPIKLVGGGRDKDYGYLGFTHWAEDDMTFIRQFPNVVSAKPNLLELQDHFLPFLYDGDPRYINLSK